jgi:protein-S-isoprenylcysteine O-methyltransferase Ste14
MTLLPDFRIGWLNGWLVLVVYLVCLLISVRAFPGDARRRLFEEPKYRMSAGERIIRTLGQFTMLVYIGMMVFTPLQIGNASSIIGILLFFGGCAVVAHALHTFRITPVGQPVVLDLYRWSRNPQWVGLVMVLTGAALMAGVLLYLAILLVVVLIYHLQILAEEQLCLEHYADGYQDYMEKVPRYFLFV